MQAVAKLIFGALIRAAERWRSIKVTEFERPQMAAVQNELDQEYEAMVGHNVKPSKGRNPDQKVQQFSDLTSARGTGKANRMLHLSFQLSWKGITILWSSEVISEIPTTKKYLPVTVLRVR